MTKILLLLILSLITAIPAVAVKEDIPHDLPEPLQPLVTAPNCVEYFPTLQGYVHDDPTILLKTADARFQVFINNYVGTLYKRERLEGEWPPLSVIKFLFRKEPYSVYMEWLKGADRADKLHYVEGKWDNKMLAHPTGLLSWIDSVKRDPQGKAARQASLNTVDEFGFGRVFDRTLKIIEKARKENELTLKYLGIEEVNGLRCLAFERILPPTGKYRFPRAIMKFAITDLMPREIILYDNEYRLEGHYIYRDLKFNVGLNETDFLAETHDL